MNYKAQQLVKVAVTYDFSETVIETLKAKDYKNVFLAVDKFLLESNTIKKLLEQFDQNNIKYYVYDEIVPNPPVELVNEGADIFKSNNCDSILAIGGGSVIDAARGINIVRKHGGSISDYVFDKEVPSFCESLIAVPTTSGTGSEVSNAVVVTDTEKNEKLTVLSDNALSEFTILAPELVVTLPPEQTKATGLDAFTHAMEAYTSVLSTPVIDAICEKIMFLIVKYLPQAVENGEDLEARERMMVAALLGGWVINNSGTQVGHSQAHVLGVKYNIPHGAACAYAAPGTLELTAKEEPKKIREIGNILNTDIPHNASNEDVGRIVSEKFKQFRDDIIQLQSFSEYDISEEELLKNAKDVSIERFAENSPVKVTEDVAEELLRKFGKQ